ncbi:hypothetical protein F9C07_2231220 [Aspergillus flavus]|uniref:Serine/threonine-protein kinase ppk6 n=3 Tax=Aspergillus subgen. Circumdati TaxID=2720871 RepID=A0A7U2QVR0_ASPFN|nr:uncharacterized protein G4B84_005270 [Aspergillus flavus NRRL3357]EIT82174.1 hypothetical protein Ao3042_00829 [Aspergillus oryzae 3.042]KAB8252245.1 hypothetical protein BDV35DRAFT_254886 [Aspergillus flavus]KDE79423.1 hypothetical protein AO1008_05899 [Aspergillus oryzae 100-8]GMG14844.1 unnamed protein product [Aspergillus oryzae]KAF7620353.1 hypothetical protein AFLA_005661 [Aspergillus flavus NRRL3357]|eukprot:EIT82174.1 hypothetical protein Ao3042_00829 [Aspergillus oryzae 3.042]
MTDDHPSAAEFDPPETNLPTTFAKEIVSLPTSMSADLFAEFGLGAPANQSSGATAQQGARPAGTTSSLIPELEIFDNAPPPGVSTSHTIQPQALSTHRNTSEKSNVSHLMHYGNDSNVLFDATLEDPPDDNSEDWGEFETADTPSCQAAPAILSDTEGNASRRPMKGPNEPKKLAVSPGGLDLLDLLSIEDKPPQRRSQSSRTLVNKSSSHKNSKVVSTASGVAEDEDAFDDWGDFVDGPPTEPPKSVGGHRLASAQVPTQKAKIAANLEKKISPTFNISSSAVSPAQIRPTNIPPPSVLLELFPRLFDQLRKEATEARKNAQEKQNIENVALLILSTLKAAARVVAGRTLRWKRDSILSQSMRIGPARAGKSGGMKLNTVNKNEDIKEQQEAVDVISMWRDRAALFNSVVQASGRRPISAIPTNIRAMTATPEQGALKASHACALCGLKREERLPKIDDQVEDSFGEWWTDHWGHTECRQFWETNVALLDQR